MIEMETVETIETNDISFNVSSLKFLIRSFGKPFWKDYGI